MDNGGVYIIGTMDGPKKIGMSGNFQQRLAHIRHGMPYRVFLLEEWAMDRVVAYAVEKIAHAMLWDDHMNGEWFNVDLPEAGWCIDRACDLITECGSLRGLLARIGMDDCEHAIGHAMTMAGLARARGEGRIGGASAKHLPERILEFAKLGTKPGARASGMSVAGFIKAVKRAKEKLGV